MNVWASWCGPCGAEFPDLVEINRMYRGREFEMVGISVDGVEAKGKVQPSSKRTRRPIANYLYSGKDIYALIEAVDPKWEGAIPYTLIVKPGGEVLYRHLGAIEPLEVKKTIVGYLGRTYK